MPIWIQPFFPFFFAFMWLLVLWLVPSLGGGRSLARCYASDSSIQGQAFSFRSGRFGFVDSGGRLRFASGPAGLSISVLFVFRPAHKPLFVPWSDVSARFYLGWAFRCADLHSVKHPEAPLRIFRGLGEPLLAGGGHVVLLAESPRHRAVSREDLDMIRGS